MTLRGVLPLSNAHLGVLVGVLVGILRARRCRPGRCLLEPARLRGDDGRRDASGAVLGAYGEAIDDDGGARVVVDDLVVGERVGARESE